MGKAKVKTASQTKVDKQNPSPELPKERFCVTITLTDGSVECHEDVTQFGPIPNRDLLGITSFSEETVVYPLTGNVKKYKFHKI